MKKMKPVGTGGETGIKGEELGIQEEVSEVRPIRQQCVVWPSV